MRGEDTFFPGAIKQNSTFAPYIYIQKFGFRLANFCIMPTHIHLLIIPGEGASLSRIMQWIKTHSAKRWNSIHGSTDHLWGNGTLPVLSRQGGSIFR